MKRSTTVLLATFLSLLFSLVPTVEARGGHGGRGGGGGHSGGYHGGYRGGFHGGYHRGFYGPRYYGGSIVYFGPYYPPLSDYSPGYYPDPYYYGSGPPASYGQPPPAGVPPAGEPPATSQKWVEVAVDQLNVRSGPGADQPVIAQVPRGFVLPVLGGTQDWWYVQLPNNVTGWVQSQFTIDAQPPAFG